MTKEKNVLIILGEKSYWQKAHSIALWNCEFECDLIRNDCPSVKTNCSVVKTHSICHGRSARGGGPQVGGVIKSAVNRSLQYSSMSCLNNIQY